MGLSVEQGSGLAATMKILQTWATYQLFIQKGNVCLGVRPDFREELKQEDHEFKASPSYIKSKSQLSLGTAS